MGISIPFISNNNYKPNFVSPFTTTYSFPLNLEIPTEEYNKELLEDPNKVLENKLSQILERRGLKY